ncbi:MAG: T9SS type A sorting domain-containing protein [Bacteroidales bacterium]
MVASKFINYKEDTLRGVMMYFNRTYEDANQITFKLTVWDDDNGKPGDIIYQRNSVRPLFTDSLNTFTVYRIDPTFIPEGTFYVGWVQTSQDMLNVGFDVNTNNQKRVFNNIYGDWVNTKFEGSIMIRPIFGNMYQTVTNITNPSSESKLKVFPNPASDYITISTSDNTTVTSVQIVNMTGTVVLNQTGSNLESINIQNLPKGLYIVKVSPKTGKYITSKLLIVR